MTPARKPSDLRASDVDRERVVAVLAEAASDGRLTLDEHSERLRALEVQPWVPGERAHWVGILPQSITGRRLRTGQSFET